MTTNNYVSLGKTDILISTIGLGTMQWGDYRLVNNADEYLRNTFCDMYNTALDVGVNLFDTAEIYGNGKSEKLLGMCYNNNRGHSILASKFMPYPWRLEKGELNRALSRSLKRMGISHIDLYQVHWPFPPMPIRVWMDAMADAVSDGLIRAVGVSNYTPAQTQIAYDQLEKHGIHLASNQVKYNLLDRNAEKSGLIELSKKLGITIIAYSPLEKGILTGKYSTNHRPTDIRAWRYNKPYLHKVEPLLKELSEIGNNHGDKTPSQVALNWLIVKGAVAIPGAKNIAQVKENSGAMGWQLTQEEILQLDVLSDEIFK